MAKFTILKVSDILVSETSSYALSDDVDMYQRNCHFGKSKMNEESEEQE